MKPVALVPCLLLLLVLAAAPAAALQSEPVGEWPLRPRPEVVRAFDPPEVAWGAGHRGVDLRGAVGQQVRTALAGRVSFVGSIAGIGVVVVDHGDTRTTYQPVAAGVRVGTVLAAGSVLGTLTWYGSHCLPAPCLHWGWIRGATYLDPLLLVGGPRPVRLLPLGAGAPASAPASAPAASSSVRAGLPVPGLALRF